MHVGQVQGDLVGVGQYGTLDELTPRLTVNRGFDYTLQKGVSPLM